MFATLLGALARPSEEADDVDALIGVAVRAQEEAGLEPITDGRLVDPDFQRVAAALMSEPTSSAIDMVVDRWRATSETTDRSVKQALPGPYSLAHSIERPGKARAGSARAASAREALTHELAARLGEVAAGLSAAGCALVEIEETAPSIGSDAERWLFTEAHRRLADGVSGTHLSLSIVGGSVGEAAWPAILDAPYASLAVDLIAGPDSWNLVTRLPGDRGVIVGVESPGEGDEPKEVLLWAAHYAASTRRRGIDRVGLGSAGSYANLTWDAAVRKMRILGEAARLAAMPPGEELASSLDPRSLDARRAALGHDAPSARRQPRRIG